jgi:TLC domain
MAAMQQPLANLIRPLTQRLNLSTLPLHIHHVLAAYLLYESLFRLISPGISRRLFKTYQHLDARGRTNWDAHVVSMAQCLLINAMALHVMLYDPERTKAEVDWRERLWGYSINTGRVQGFAAGYFLWDSLVSIEHMDVLGASSLVHGLAALGITGLGFRPFANYYGINFVLFELSTPFLNVHWFLDKFGMTGSIAQLVNGILLITSFFCCRIVWGCYQSYLIYNDIWSAWHVKSSLSNGCAMFFRATKLVAQKDVPFRCRVLPTWLGATYFGAIITLTVLNVYWFGKMVAAVRRRFTTKKKVEKKEQ